MNKERNQEIMVLVRTLNRAKSQIETLLSKLHKEKRANNDKEMV